MQEEKILENSIDILLFKKKKNFPLMKVDYIPKQQALSQNYLYFFEMIF